MAQNYGPGSPYPTTETGKRMAAAGIPIFAGGQDPSVYMQSGENAVVGRPATFTGAPGSEAGMTPEMLAKLKASMGGQVQGGPDYEFMPASEASAGGAPPVMSETMPSSGMAAPDGRGAPGLTETMPPPQLSGGGFQTFGPPMLPPQSAGGETGAPAIDPAVAATIRGSGSMQNQIGAPMLPPPSSGPIMLPPASGGGRNQKGGPLPKTLPPGRNPRVPPWAPQQMDPRVRKTIRKWSSGGMGLPPGVITGMAGNRLPQWKPKQRGAGGVKAAQAPRRIF